MEEPKRRIEKSLQLMQENNQKVNLYKLEADENGNYLLDQQNQHHRNWYENDEEFDMK